MRCCAAEFDFAAIGREGKFKTRGFFDTFGDDFDGPDERNQLAGKRVRRQWQLKAKRATVVKTGHFEAHFVFDADVGVAFALREPKRRTSSHSTLLSSCQMALPSISAPG